MSQQAYALLKFCKKSVGSLSQADAERVFDFVKNHSPYLLSGISKSDFLEANASSKYDAVSEIDVLTLSSSLKSSVYRMLKSAENESLPSVTKNNIFVLPELPASTSEKKQSELDTRVSSFMQKHQDVHVHKRDSSDNALVLSDAISRLSHEVNALERKKSQLLYDLRQNAVASAIKSSQDDKSSKLQQELPVNSVQSFAHIPEADDLSASENEQLQTITSVPQNKKPLVVSDSNEEKYYAETLANRFDQLQKVRQELQDERKKLYEIRLVITNLITNIDDPRLAHVLDDINKKHADLDAKEKILLEQQDLSRKSIEHAEQRVLYLQSEESKIRDRMIALDKERHQLDQQAVLLRNKVIEEQNQYEVASKRSQQMAKQIAQAQDLYKELNEQAQRISDDIKLSREELSDWEKDLQAREKKVAATEKDLQQLLQQEREGSHKKARELEKIYRDNMRSLQQKEQLLATQRHEILSLKEELVEVRKSLQKERAELDARERDLSERAVLLRNNETDLSVRRSTLDETARQSIEYLEQLKRDHQQKMIAAQAQVDQRLVELQKREAAFLHKEQNLLNTHPQMGSSRERASLNKEQQDLARRSRELSDAMGILVDFEKKYPSIVPHQKQASQSSSKDDMKKQDNNPDLNVEDFFSDVKSERPKPLNNFISQRKDQKNQALPEQPPKSDYRLDSTSDIPVPELGSLTVPRPEAIGQQALLPDDPAEQSPTVEEIEALCVLAKEELAKDLGLARLTYGQIRDMYHKMSANDKKMLFPKLMSLYDEIQSKGSSGI